MAKKSKRYPTRQDITIRNLRAMKKLWEKELKDFNKRLFETNKKLAQLEKAIEWLN